MKHKDNAVLSIDLGGSKYIGGLVDSDGKIIYSNRKTWDSYDSEYVLDCIYKAADDVFGRYPQHNISAMGLTIPGLADPDKGIFVYSDVMDIRDLPLADLLKDRYGLPIFLDNDARACAFAEQYFGAGKGCEFFLYITVSNGIGGALVLDNKLYYGAHGNAGEIGQCIMESDAKYSKCGRSGTLEEMGNAQGIIKNYIYLGGMAEIEGEAANGKNIAELARKSDKIAREAFQLEGYYLGKAIAAVYNVLDFEKVIIGGGLSLAFDLFEKELMDTLLASTFKRNSPELKVVATPLKYEGALIGAAALALQGLGVI